MTVRFFEFLVVVGVVAKSRTAERVAANPSRRCESSIHYTPTTCFETFPFPEPTDAQRAEIAAAAKELDELRTNWLNPPEWTREEILEFPGSVDGLWRRYLSVDVSLRETNPLAERADYIGTMRYPRLVPKTKIARRC